MDCFVDDSLRDRWGFNALGVVYASTDVLETAAHVIAQSSVPEFKSGVHMGRNPMMADLRTTLLRLLTQCRLGLVLAPSASRDRLGADLVEALEKFGVETSGVFVDESIQPGESTAVVSWGQDSRCTVGIQLADLAAHTLSTIVVERLRPNPKRVQLGPDYGYDVPITAELEWELRTGVRWALIKKMPPFDEENFNASLTANCFGFGVHCTPDLEGGVRAAASEAFSRVWMGCVH